MPVVIVHEGLSQQQSQAVVRSLTGKDRMESLRRWPAEGLLVHAERRSAARVRGVRAPEQNSRDQRR